MTEVTEQNKRRIYDRADLPDNSTGRAITRLFYQTYINETGEDEDKRTDTINYTYAQLISSYGVDA